MSLSRVQFKRHTWRTSLHIAMNALKFLITLSNRLYISPNFFFNSRVQRATLSTDTFGITRSVSEGKQSPSELRSPPCSLQRLQHHRKRGEQQYLWRTIKMSKGFDHVDHIRLRTLPVFTVVLNGNERDSRVHNESPIRRTWVLNASRPWRKSRDCRSHDSSDFHLVTEN